MSLLCLAATIVGLSLAFAEGRLCAQPLCINGHPIPRSHSITYAGLSPRHGFQRDHRVPLCLGGADDASNVWYQPIAEAEIKDRLEWATCEAYCRGDISLEQARGRFK
jgi:hypothetical protein